MKKIIKLPLLAGSLALTFAIAGCGNTTEPTANTEVMTAEAPPMSGDMDNMAMANSAEVAKGATPGTPTMAGPFEVTLTLDAPEPKVGDAQFKALVTRDGKPVTDATVKLELSMPQMNMGGPTAPLAHTEKGVYAGTANLSMGGAYSAKVNVMANNANQGRGAMGDAIYEFRAVQ